jgi:hypothetical protein
MPVEMALDLASLALYDIILYGEHTVLSKKLPAQSCIHSEKCKQYRVDHTRPTPLRRLLCIMMLSCTSETRTA